ncbi:Uncharacterized protein YvpB [Salinibacillus kushneri]|uniref:Uncharacterized protein YvpB n=1 Tax=Salinibacillus kushneri TaxID=237682 RepID=A0A1I0FC51_9BACI|nr:C39 family peptidase [Salinibacillus kushneri]SET55437.1 Uncharacterized protein YvpB [Salinibacillus kushneri]
MLNRYFVIIFITLSLLLLGCNTTSNTNGTSTNPTNEESKTYEDNSFEVTSLSTKSHSLKEKDIDLLNLKKKEKNENNQEEVNEDNKKIDLKKEQVQKQDQDQMNQKKKKPSFEPTKHKATLQISTQAANIRKGPHTSYAKVTTLKQYTKLDAFEKAKVEGLTWYHVYIGEQKKGWISSAIVEKYDPNAKKKVEKKSSNKKLLSAPLVSQMPELPRGCEVTALSMLLGHAGVNVDKMTLAEGIKRDSTPFTRKNGQVQFGNPNDGFVGDMYSFDNPGLGVYHGPIADLGEKYLPGRIVDLTGKNFDTVLNQLDNGKPVWVLTTSWFSHVPESYWETWNTPTGKVKVTYKMHSVLVTGYDNQYIYFNDPLANQKNRKVAKDSFIAGWNQMGNQAITYK